MILVFTICSNNYLAQAITLGQSLLAHNPQYIFKIGLVDRKNSQIDYSIIPFEIIEVESIGISAFNDMFKRYNITELNTAVKPYYFQHFLKSYKNSDKIIYLDPDILVYSPFTDLETILDENEIVITPHFTTPICDDKWQAENDFLNSGLYNLGFIALKKGEESQKLIDWWALRLETKAYINLAKGMFTDQIWINLAPLYFNKVHIFRHSGYNMAYWNLHERYLADGNLVVKENYSSPLVFYHFSGFNPLYPEILSEYQDRFSFENRNDIAEIFNDYSKTLFENGYKTFRQITCYYAIEKQKNDLAAYISYKKTIPVYKRLIRGVVLRLIRLFRINIDYYTHSFLSE
jgi:lipopolysaccharide biosynthesis glycosyltransferase